MSVANYTGRIVSGKGLCPVCGQKKSWSYAQGDDKNTPAFVICYGSSPATPGWKYLGDNDFGGSKYIRKDVLRSDGPLFPQIIPEPEAQPEIAPIEQRDRVYRVLLALCTLLPKHLRQLKRREFSAHRIAQMKAEGVGSIGGYKGRVALVKRLCEGGDLGYEDLQGVPGFYVNKDGQWTLAGVPGLLLPSCDEKGRIQGLQIRPSKPKGGAKYIWLSSARYADSGGSSSGSPVGVVYPEGWRSDQEITSREITSREITSREITRVALTEGYFKAQALVEAEKVPVLWFAGTGVPSRVIELLKKLGSPSEITLFYDGDWRTNPTVRKAMCKMALALSAYRDDGQASVSALGWHSTYGKGIDDALLKGKMPYDEDHLQRYDLAIDLKRLQGAQESTFKHSHINTDLSNLPLTWEPQELIAKEQVWSETRKAILAGFDAKAGTFMFITAGTGGSKSYTCVHEAPKGTIFVFSNYKVLKETEEALKAQGKRVGVFYGRQKEPGPLSPDATEEQRKEHAAQRERFEKAGCPNFAQASEAGGANHNPCIGCPLFDYHHNPLLNPNPELACLYWPQREKIEAEKPDYLLMMPQALMNHSHLMEPYRYVIFDDVDTLDLLFSNKIKLSLANVEQWLSHPSIGDVPQPLFAFMSYLEGLLRLDNKEGGWTREHLKELAAEALGALHKELAKKHREKQPKMASCEQPFEKEEQAELTYPHKRLLPLLETIVKGLPYTFGSDHIQWLEPHSKAIEALKEKVSLFLDATPRLWYWRELLPSLGFTFSAPTLPRIFPTLVQICDRLYSKEQIEELKPTIEALREALGEEQTALFSFQDMFEGQHGHFGRDERGLNQFASQGFEQMLIAGHYQMSEADARDYAWCLRAFAQHMGIAPPAVGFEECEEPDKQGKVWRKYADPYRPYERKSYRSKDPLAEKIRRAHNTSSALQLASRLRSARPEIMLFSGDPLDGLDYEIPVELVTLPELLKKHGIEQSTNEKPALNDGLAAWNQQREEETERKYQENLQWALEWTIEQKQLPTSRQLRHLLAEDEQTLASSQMAQRVLNGLLCSAEQMNQKRPCFEEAWSLFEDHETLGGEGTRGVSFEIGSTEPHTALINEINLKGEAWFGPDLSFGKSLIGLEREGEEAFSETTTPLPEGTAVTSIGFQRGEAAFPSKKVVRDSTACVFVVALTIALAFVLVGGLKVGERPRRTAAFCSFGPSTPLRKRGRGWAKRSSEAVRAVVAWWLCWRAACSWLMICSLARRRKRRSCHLIGAKWFFLREVVGLAVYVVESFAIRSRVIS